MKRCARCVLPGICPRISFSSEGICNVCYSFDEKWGDFGRRAISRKTELNKILRSYRNNGRFYDCLVPLSGGLDSTFALYVCKRVYDLRTLAFNFDNGFQTEIAKQNIENATRKLGVDLVTRGPGLAKVKKLSSLFFRKTGEFCTPCNLGIWSMSYKLAKDFRIPLIVSGSSDRISERLPRGGRIYQWSPLYFRKVIKGEVPKKDVKEYLYLPRNFHNRILRSISERIFSPESLRILPIFDYIEYNVFQMIETLRNQVNWRQKADKFHHIDCVMESVNDYLKQRKWRFSASAWYSMLIRTGQMTRAEALQKTLEEEERNTQSPPEFELWSEMLGLSSRDIEGFEKRSQIPYFSAEERMYNAADYTLEKILVHSRLIDRLQS